MNSARLRVLAVISIVAIAAGLLAVEVMPRLLPIPSQHPAARRPTLLLLTSLPLVFNEDFSLHGGGSPALKVLRIHYEVLPISVTDRVALEKGSLLLMAQPFPQTAENLVALDAWVRRGGRLLLFADPMLEWPSKRPLGDLLRPPAMFMDTGLLAHWGLRLDAPDMQGPSERMLGGHEVVTVSPGSLHGRCKLSIDRFVAHCRIGKGRATIVADADLLDVGKLGPGSAENLDGVLGELETLKSAQIR
ncbi:MAG TPA: hypothetical protein VM711_06595 [Sphingomicrobium sp.]|nr:hypothetical protein [Sphingomicrobium sp.]